MPTIMPSKAELRRLMKLHRAKLQQHDSTSSQQESQLQQEELAATTTTKQSNKLVKGILKPSSVSKQSVTDAGVAASLLAGYASSSESEPDEADERDEEAKHSSGKLESSSSAPEKGKVRFHVTTINDAEPAEKSLSISSLTASAVDTQQMEALPIDSKIPSTSIAQQSNLDSAWEEFEAMLSDDNDGRSEQDVATQIASNSEMPPTIKDNAEQMEVLSSSAALENSITASDADPTTQSYAQVEQSSYEARLARLRSKVKKRPRPAAREPTESNKAQDNDDGLPQSAAEPTNLAFVEESSDQNLSLLPSAPLGQLLRKKRARARALVGWDDETGTNS